MILTLFLCQASWVWNDAALAYMAMEVTRESRGELVKVGIYVIHQKIKISNLHFSAGTPMWITVHSTQVCVLVLQDPRSQLNFCISGLVYVECTEALYYDNPDLQDPRFLLNSVYPGYHCTKPLCILQKNNRRYRNSAEIGGLAVHLFTYVRCV